MSRYVIINQHSGNFGDDAAGCSLVNMLLDNAETERIDIIYNADRPIPVSDNRVHHDFCYSFSNIGYFNLAFALIRWILFRHVSSYSGAGSLINMICAADQVFVAPCGANIGIYRDWVFLARVVLVILCGKTPIFHLNTIGKSGDWLFDHVSAFALRRAKVYVREKKSLEYVNSIGVTAKLGPDTAFALKPIVTRPKNYIAFVPSELDSWHPSFKNSHVNERVLNELVPCLASVAIKNQLNVIVVPHLQSNEERAFNDEVVNKLLESGCGKSQVFFANEVSSFFDYDEVIAASRFVVGMRYHAVVLAAKNYRPFIALSYENKMYEVCRYTSMTDYYFNLQSEEFDVEKLEAMSESVLLNEDELVSRLTKIVRNELRPSAHMVLNDCIDM